MVNWIVNIQLFSPNILLKLFSKTTITELFNSVSFSKLSYKNSFLFIFLSCCVGNLHCEELEKDYKDNIQKFNERKQKELDSLPIFYEPQRSVAFENKAEPPPITEQPSLISKSYAFATEYYFISLLLSFIFLDQFLDSYGLYYPYSKIGLINYLIHFQNPFSRPFIKNVEDFKNIG